MISPSSLKLDVTYDVTAQDLFYIVSFKKRSSHSNCIFSYILKEVTLAITSSFLLIINNFLITGYAPTFFKSAIIKPLLKKKQKTMIQLY